MATSFNVGKIFSKAMYFSTNLTYALFYKIDIHKFNFYNPGDNLKIIYYAFYYLFNPSISKQTRKRFSLNPNMAIIERFNKYLTKELFQ